MAQGLHYNTQFCSCAFLKKTNIEDGGTETEHSIVCTVYYSVTYGYRRIVLFCQLNHTQADWAL